MKCECGNKKFNAHQVCHVDIVVDGDNSFLENPGGKGMEANVYESGTPFGPYSCTECGKEYSEIT